MYTTELSYVLAVSFLLIFFLVNGSVNYHQELHRFSSFHMEEEIKGHSMDEEKTVFRPERFIRAATLLEAEGKGDGENREEQES